MNTTASPYSDEERELLIKEWRAKNASTGIKASTFAREKGVPLSAFCGWIRYRDIIKPAKQLMKSQSLVKVEPIIKETEACSVLLEYCGAKISVNNEKSMKMLLSSLKELSFT